MKFDDQDREPELDRTDLLILDQLQENCKRPLAAIGEKVGLTAPSVMERIHKLEQAGVIREYVAVLDAKRLCKDITAFIGVSISHPRAIGAFEQAIRHQDEVLDCHHVTGAYTLILKIKADDTDNLERVIQRLREIEGVTRTETMVVLSTHTERTRIALPLGEPAPPRRRGRRGARSRRPLGSR
jgi:Lrp/AsnC family transcriptional regulator, leucine-responsive regulatory protein